MNGLQSELLKYKRTFMGKLIVLIPIFFAIFAFIIQYIMSNNSLAQSSGNTSMRWTTLLALVFNWWSFLFLPLGMALFASLVTLHEKKAGNYRTLRAYNISPIKIWIDKIAGMAFYSLLSSLVLAAVVMVTGLCIVEGAPPAAKILTGSLLCWLTSLALIPLQIWVATWGGMLVSMAVGFAGMTAGVLAAPSSLWIAVPWSWATRMMCPVIGVQPNGSVLNFGSPLLDSSVIPDGIAISLTALAVVSVLTGIWFKRREMR